MKIKVEVEISDRGVNTIKRLGNTPYSHIKETEEKFWDQQCLYLGTQVLVAICKDQVEVIKN